MKQKKKLFLGIGLAVLLLAVAGAVIYYVQVVQKDRKSYETYLEGFELYKEGKFEEAEKLLLSVEDYGETKKILTDLYYQQGLAAFENQEYEKAKEFFSKNPEYQDSADYLKETSYQLGIAAYEAKDYDKAEGYFNEISGYKEVQNYVDGIAYARLLESFAAGDYDKAEACILAIPDMDGIQPYAVVVLQAQAQKNFENLQYEHALELYEQGLKYADWVENTYKNLSEEKKIYEFDPIRGEVSFEDRIKQMEEEYDSVKKEYQAVTCLKQLVTYYEEQMKDTAVISQVDEIRVAMQAYSSDNIVPVIMIAYKETVTEKNKEKQQQAYAVYNETDFYAICHSLKMEEIDKSNSDELQANLRITQYWEAKDAVKMDMTRIRKAMGWE